jgi:hypothetical protein
MAVWTPGIDNYRVQYQAGYSTIPNDLQEACAEWAAALFWQTKQPGRRPRNTTSPRRPDP